MTDIPVTAVTARQVRSGLGWSAVSNIVLRFGNVLLTILLARLLAPQAFGVFAVAITVQSVLVALVDLGLSADLIRSDRPSERAPTVATLSVGCGVALCLLMSATAGPLATLMGNSNASGVIVAMSVTLLISGLSVVPNALLTREFKQRALALCAAVDFVVSTAVTVSLVLAGVGPMGLAIGKIAGQTANTTLQFVLAHERVRLGFNSDVARSALAFGGPIAAANILSWIGLNVDNIVVASVAGDVQLGLYVLAFNVANWPMSVVGLAVRNVALPAFARQRDDQQRTAGGPLLTALSMTWLAAAAVGVLLSALAVPLVTFLYGPRWLPSANALVALAVFGSLRVAMDLMVTYLLAHGASRAVMIAQIVWLVALTPVMFLFVHQWGIVGAAWAHVVVAVFVVLPIYLLALRRLGVGAGGLLLRLVTPLLAAGAAWLVTRLVLTWVRAPIWQLVAGGVACGTVFLLLTSPVAAGLHRNFRQLRATAGSSGSIGSGPTGAVQ